MTESGFTIDVDQNQYLPEGGREVSAVVTVTSAADATGLAGSGPAGAEPEGSAEIIVRTISTALLGSVDIVPDPSGLAADFATMMQSAMSKQVADVALRVWIPQHATVKFVKQVAPTVDDLTARRAPSGPQSGGAGPPVRQRGDGQAAGQGGRPR
jgi:hypothetical protein